MNDRNVENEREKAIKAGYDERNNVRAQILPYVPYFSFELVS